MARASADDTSRALADDDTSRALADDDDTSRALANDDTSAADVSRANSEAFFYKLDNMEFQVANATIALLQDNQKYILCLETPETSLMSALLAKILRNLEKDRFSNQHRDQIFTDFHNFIKINKQQNWADFPDLLVCKVGIDEQLEQHSDVLTSWAKLVQDKSRKIIFIMKDFKYLERSMMKSKLVNVLKLKFTELWEEDKTLKNEEYNYCDENKAGIKKQITNKKSMNDELSHVVSKAVTDAIKNVKSKEEASKKSALPKKAELMEARSILKLLGVESINAVDEIGNTPLHVAAQNGQNEIVKTLLVCDVSIESRNYEGYTPLHLATKGGHHKVVSTLLEKGANANIMAADNGISRRKETSLQMACYNNDVRLIEILLKFGANVETKDQHYGNTPLHIAFKECHYEVASTLLENNANFNAINHAHETPLYIACQKNYVRLVELLLKFGVNIETKDQRDGNTLLHSAVELGHHELVSILLKNNAKVNAINNSNQTPLHLACCANDVSLIELLLKFGAKMETKDNRGYTPLHQATLYGYNTVITTLLQHGSNINAQDNDGYTPLHHATQNNEQEVLKNLLENGADTNIKNHRNQTALDLAISMRQRNLISIICKNSLFWLTRFI